MRILLINSSHSKSGGAHTVYLNTGKMLQDAGHQVIYFACHSNNEQECIQSNFFASSINKKNSFNYILKHFYNYNASQKLRQIIQKYHPDIAHIHLLWGSLSSSILDTLQDENIPIVHTVHDYAMICPHVTLRGDKNVGICEKCANGKYYKCATSKCFHGNIIKSAILSSEMYFRKRILCAYSKIDSYVFVSNFCKNKHVEMDSFFSKTNNYVLHNFQNNEIVNYKESKQHCDYYLYYGRISYEKGISNLIKAFEKFPHLQLKIVGTGPLKVGLEQYCIDKNLKNVEFLGFNEGNALYKLVAEAKFVCVPSEWYENNPMTIIEAYSLGTPVIGANIGGIPEILINTKTGFLFESGSIGSLIQSINKSISISEKDYFVMNKCCEKCAKEMFGQEQYLFKLEGIYKDTIAKRQLNRN